MHFVRRALLPATVFITGGCVLVIEVVATRILAPYFGNTIYSISSVISVVLAALSIGYYGGGRLADKRTNRTVFFGIIAVGGIAVLGMQALQDRLLSALGHKLSLASGPLIMALLLFLVPNVVLGMLSPFAIALEQRAAKNQGVGTTAGEIFFFSTVGSIAGSLLAGFVLIPHAGVRAIVIGVGVLLVLVGVSPLIVWRADRRLTALLCFLAAAAFLLTFVGAPARVLYAHDGVYERVTIYNGGFKGRPARFLQLDNNNSGASYLNSNELPYDYTKYFALYTIFAPQMQRALVLGGGAYSIPKALLSAAPEARIDVAEIEPSLYTLSKQYFGLYDNPRLHNYVADGRRMLYDSHAQYDFMYSDVYNSPYSIPAHFTTKEFFELVRARLAPHGVFAANLIGSVQQRSPSFIWSEIRTMQQVFPQVYVFAVESPRAGWDQNIIVVGSNNSERLDMYNANTFVSPYEVIRGLPDHYIDTTHADLARYPVLTDDFAPVDYLMARAWNQ